MRQIILLGFLVSIAISVPSGLADYDKNSVSSNESSSNSATGPTAQPVPAPANKPGTTKLFGRIEQIVQGPGAQFPVTLQAQTAKLDTRQTARLHESAETFFSGTLVKSFPAQFAGNWGGTLKIWTSQIDPIAWQIDPDEANSMRRLLTSDRQGTVNFSFTQERSGTINLEPARVAFMVPLKDTDQQEKLNQMLGSDQLGQLPGVSLPGMDSKQLNSMMKQMMTNMNVPVIISFGAAETSQYMVGISGNSLKSVVLKNTVRQLTPGVLEQQIVTRGVQRNNKTGRVRQEYAETVIRFTNRGANDLYVLAATVNYTEDRKFESKLILYGNVHRGQVMPDMSNPLGGLENMMPGNAQLPKMPAGQNPLKDMFPQ